MHEEQRLCFGFPLWLVQVEANFVARHANRIAPNLAKNEPSSAGCNDATSVSFSGHQTWRPSTLNRRNLRLETIINQCRTKFAPTWTSQGGKQKSVPWNVASVWFPNLLPPGRARVESKIHHDVPFQGDPQYRVRLTAFQNRMQTLNCVPTSEVAHELRRLNCCGTSIRRAGNEDVAAVREPLPHFDCPPADQFCYPFGSGLSGAEFDQYVI